MHARRFRHCAPVVQQLVALVQQVQIGQAGQALQLRPHCQVVGLLLAARCGCAPALLAASNPQLLALELQRQPVLWGHEQQAAHLRRKGEGSSAAPSVKEWLTQWLTQLYMHSTSQLQLHCAAAFRAWRTHPLAVLHSRPHGPGSAHIKLHIAVEGQQQQLAAQHAAAQVLVQVGERLWKQL